MMGGDAGERVPSREQRASSRSAPPRRGRRARASGTSPGEGPRRGRPRTARPPARPSPRPSPSAARAASASRSEPIRSATRRARSSRSAASAPSTVPIIAENGIGSRPARSHASAILPAATGDLLERGKRRVVLVGEARGERGATRAGVAAHDQVGVGLLDGLGLRVEVREHVVLAVEREAARRPNAPSAPGAALRARPSGPRSARNGKPYASCSRSCQPAPMPRSIRPPETWSAVTTSLASTDGWRKLAGETSVPSRSFVVSAASALIVAPGVERSALGMLPVEVEIVVRAKQRRGSRAPRRPRRALATEAT